MDETCACGHHYDEHEPPECTIDGCPCIHFEADPVGWA